MSSPVRPEGVTLAQPIPVPTLTVLPPSSDTESWSRSPSPRITRSNRRSRSHHSRTRAKKRNAEEHGCFSESKWSETPQIMVEETASTSQSQSALPPTSVITHMEEDDQIQDSPSQDLLLPPSHSWSRSPSPSRRSRWSLRSLLSRDSDGDSCRLVCWIHTKSRASREVRFSPPPPSPAVTFTGLEHNVLALSSIGTHRFLCP